MTKRRSPYAHMRETKCKLRIFGEIQAFESNKSDDAAFMSSHKTSALSQKLRSTRWLSFKFENFSSFIMMINQRSEHVEYGVRAAVNP
jgi:hypothetical protein